MSRWWDRYGFRTIIVVIALSVSFWIGQTKAGLLAEFYQFVVEPFQSRNQLALQERLVNARILELEQRVGELQQQNQQLKQLLNYVEVQTTETITAPVIGRNRDRWWNRVTLGKGTDAGIKPGYIVMGIGGLVGRVTHVTSHTSQVLLVSDTASRVGAVLSSSRQLGYVEGDTSSTVIMHFFERVTNIKAGEQVITSTLSNLYPPGLPIGKVKSLKEDKSLSEVEVELNAPIDVLEWVVVRSFEPKL